MEGRDRLVVEVGEKEAFTSHFSHVSVLLMEIGTQEFNTQRIKLLILTGVLLTSALGGISDL